MKGSSCHLRLEGGDRLDYLDEEVLNAFSRRVP